MSLAFRVDALAGESLLFLFGIAMLWLGTLVGTLARSPDAVAGIAFMVVFPLTFVSNAFVPIGGLPNGLQQVAEWNPISAMVAAVRTLFGNPTGLPADPPWPLAHPVLAATLWSLLILAIAIPLTVRRFLARTPGRSTYERPTGIRTRGHESRPRVWMMSALSSCR